MTTKSWYPYQRLSPKLNIGKQINALADYVKHVSNELVFLLRIVKSDQCLFNTIFFKFFVVAAVVYLFVVVVVVFSWYKLDRNFFADLCKFFQFQIKCW